MDNINDLIRQKKEYKQVRDDKYRQDSRDRLAKIIKKKVETTMIGALSSIEQHFGFLWENKNDQLTQEQQIMFDLYQKIRSEILDKGNTQSRNIDAELAQYDVNWLKYNVTIPVKTV